MVQGDTISAISSAIGPAARMIVRVSGPGSHPLADRLMRDGWADPADGSGSHPSAPATRAWACRCVLRFGGVECPAWVYRFTGPRSYSGEDLVELHLPGNAVLAEMLMSELVSAGARRAEAGEFTARAYFNGRIDLTEAEGVAATISAQSERELAAARQLAAGELSRRLRPVMDLVADTAALVEVGIDFVEEDVTFLPPSEVAERAQRAEAALAELVRDSARFERVSHEPQVVLVGRPNAGKSTLLNALAGYERAVVSPAAGTTRDVLWVEVVLPSGIIRLVDAAGLEGNDEIGMTNDEARMTDVGGDVGQTVGMNPTLPTEDLIERQMRRGAMRAVAEADRVVLVREVGDARAAIALPREADLVVVTKIDTEDGRSGVGLIPAVEPMPVGMNPALRACDETCAVSALSGTGMEALRRRLDELAFGGGGGGAVLALNARHLEAIGEAQDAVCRAGVAAAGGAGAEIVALELREALSALGRVVGEVTPDDLLGRVFATFCIGK